MRPVAHTRVPTWELEVVLEPADGKNLSINVAFLNKHYLHRDLHVSLYLMGTWNLHSVISS